MTSGRRRILLAEITAKIPAAIAIATFSDGTVSKTVAGWTGPGTASNWLSTIEVSAGKVYWETTIGYTGTANAIVGVAGSNADASPFGELLLDGSGIAATAGIGKSGTAKPSSVVVAPSIASGSVIRSWLDMDAKVYRVAVNNGPWVVIASLDNGWPQYLTPDVQLAPHQTLRCGVSLYRPDTFGTSLFVGVFGT